MYQTDRPSTVPSKGPLPRHRTGPNNEAVLAALIVALSLLAFTFAAPPGEGPLGAFASKAALADGGHGVSSHPATQTPTPSTSHQPGIVENHDETDMAGMDDMHVGVTPQPTPAKESSTEQPQASQSSTTQSGVHMRGDHESTGSEEMEMDMSNDHPSDAADDHEENGSDEHGSSSPDADDHDSTGSGEMDMHDDISSDEHGSSGFDDHESASSDEEGSHPHGTEYEGPSDLVRNITLGGFAGINGSVLLAAAILKKKNPKKDKGKGAPNRMANTTNTPVIPVTPITVDIGPTANVVSTASASPESAPEAAPTPNTINTAEIAPSKGDDLA